MSKEQNDRAAQIAAAWQNEISNSFGEGNLNVADTGELIQKFNEAGYHVRLKADKQSILVFNAESDNVDFADAAKVMVDKDPNLVKDRRALRGQLRDLVNVRDTELDPAASDEDRAKAKKLSDANTAARAKGLDDEGVPLVIISSQLDDKTKTAYIEKIGADQWGVRTAAGRALLQTASLDRRVMLSNPIIAQSKLNEVLAMSTSSRLQFEKENPGLFTDLIRKTQGQTVKI